MPKLQRVKSFFGRSSKTAYSRIEDVHHVNISSNSTFMHLEHLGVPTLLTTFEYVQSKTIESRMGYDESIICTSFCVIWINSFSSLLQVFPLRIA